MKNKNIYSIDLGRVKKATSGTGIGLSIVKQIIQHLNGDIWLESEEGIGSVFYFKIPLGQSNSQN